MDTTALISGILSSIIATVLIALFAWSRGWLVLSWRSLRGGFSLYRRMEAAGITNFYASRDDFAKFRGAPRLLDYLSLARRTIHVASYWMSHGIEMEGIANSLAQMTRDPKNLIVTVAVIDPTAPYLDALASYLNMQSNEVRIRAQSSLFKLWRAREGLATDEKLRFNLKVYSTIPVASVIALDAGEPDGRVQVDLKAYRSPRQNSFAFEVRGSDRILYELCKNSWLRLLQEADDFDPGKHLVGYWEEAEHDDPRN